MKSERLYTTQLQAGLGLIEETRILLDLWEHGMPSTELYQVALNSGNFPNVSARRLQNIVGECFTPRYLVDGEYPANVLKQLHNRLSSQVFSQLLFLFTARANAILADFVKDVFWNKYAGGHDSISNQDAKQFVIDANQAGKTRKPWSESTIKKVSSYLTGCCADFGLLASGRRNVRKIYQYHADPVTIGFLAHDLHFLGLGDNAVLAHPDWQLFGLQKADVRDEFKRLSYRGFFIVQTAADVVHIGWNYKNWKDFINVVTEG